MYWNNWKQAWPSLLWTENEGGMPGVSLAAGHQSTWKSGSVMVGVWAGDGKEPLPPNSCTVNDNNRQGYDFFFPEAARFPLPCWLEPDPVCWLSTTSPPFPVSLFIKTLSRAWFSWSRLCQVVYQMWLVPQRSREVGKVLPWIILFSFLCWKRVTPRWASQKKGKCYFNLKIACVHWGHRGQLEQLKWWLSESCLIKSLVTCWTQVNGHEMCG